MDMEAENTWKTTRWSMTMIYRIEDWIGTEEVKQTRE